MPSKFPSAALPHEKGHITPRLQEPRPKIAANGARADNENAHDNPFK
jgi:hypothetical protein